MLLFWVLGSLLYPLNSRADAPLAGVWPAARPSQAPLSSPDDAAPASAGRALPPIAPPPKEQLSSQIRIPVRRFQFTGNTVFSDEELQSVTAPYENRVITSEDLQEVRRQLTLYYVNRGYINSGAVIPDQRVVDGVIELRIVEGQLTDIDIAGNKRLRSPYISERLTLDLEAALNMQDIQQHLQLLHQNPLIEQINAELVPGLNPGEGVLKVQVQEAPPLQLGVTIANDRPPSVGAEQARPYAIHRNLTGWGDTLSVMYGRSFDCCSNNWYVAYTLPLNARDTTLGIWYEKYDTDIIEQVFEDLDTASELETLGIALRHPVYKTPQRTFSLGLELEKQRSKTFLLGEGFSFSPGARDGVAKVTPLRFSQEWLDRRLNQVIAARSVFSLGLNAFGATINDSSPDGQYFAWLGQFQWARRFGDNNQQVIVRTDVQLSADALLPQVKCAIGGINTVRGYRENRLVRDNCFVASLEFRIPIFRIPIPYITHSPEQGWVSLAPFADFGWARNTDVLTELNPNTISSAGVGLRWDVSPQIRGEIYWGHPFRHFDDSEDNLQDIGIHFRVELSRLF